MQTNRKKVDKPLQALERLFGYVGRDYRWTLVLVFFAIGFSVFAQVRGALFLQVIVDEHIMPFTSVGVLDYTELIPALVWMGAIYVVGAISAWIFQFFMVIVSAGVQRKIRNEMFSKMQSLGIKYFDENMHGDLMSRYTNDVDTMRSMLTQAIPETVRAIFTIVTTFIGMVSLSLVLSLIVIVFVFMMFLITKYITKKSRASFSSQQKAMGKLNGYIEEMMSGQKVVKVFAQEVQVKKEFNDLNEGLTTHIREANRYSNILFPVLVNLGHLLYGIVALIGGVMVIGGIGGLSIGMVASFLYLSRTFVMPVSQIALQINATVMALAASERIFAILDEEAEINEGTKEIHAASGNIEFQNVHFSYQEGKSALRGVSFSVNNGEKVAIIGKTGAGKTTISNLITRFYDINKGQILFDGIDIREIDKQSLRKQVGIVLQDTKLFTGTIAENIKYAKPEASINEIKDAAKLAYAHDFIEKLPNGYDTIITDNGAALSVGQAQLIGIARTVITNPTVIILDEATANVDTLTEKLVQKGFKSLMQNRTSIVIAHRLSTILDADHILVMDAGKIIESGVHEQLIELGGRYAELYNMARGVS